MGVADVNQALVEVDAGAAAAEHARTRREWRRRTFRIEGPGRKGRVHAAVADHTDAPGRLAVDLMRISQRRENEGVALAVHVSGRDYEGVHRRAVTAPGHEQGNIAVELGADVDQTGGVVGDRERIPRIRGINAGEALIARAGAFNEIALGGVRGARRNSQRQRGQTHAEQMTPLLHFFPPGRCSDGIPDRARRFGRILVTRILVMRRCKMITFEWVQGCRVFATPPYIRAISAQKTP